MKRITTLLLALAVMLLSSTAFAQYNTVAGQSAPRAKSVETYVDRETGEKRERTVYVAPQRDDFGNAQGTQYDLATDGAFEGQTVAVIQLYPFSFEDARAALKQKGFGVYRWSNAVPSPEELEKKLEKACQLWVISGDQQHLTKEHVAVIKRFFDSGKGVYIWGDNTPYHADANILAGALFDSSMQGGFWGDTVVHMKMKESKSGLLPDHLLTTGLEHIFEGITIAAIKLAGGLKPLIWSSDGQVVTAIYEKNGKRAILDGGFTRLYNKWDTAGTGRYVKNAAAWLVNVERFGDEVAAAKKEAKENPKTEDVDVEAKDTVGHLEEVEVETKGLVGRIQEVEMDRRHPRQNVRR